jgi:hypothetical protein
VDATHPDTSFGGWSCGWESTTSDLSADVRFDRDQSLDASDGRPVTMSGRSAFVSSEDDGPETCAVLIVFRQYADTVELVAVIARGPGTQASLCGLATKLGQAVAAKLPRA